jgi:quinol monooxygenase YgiN
MGQLEVVAHMKIRPGQLEGFTAQAAEILASTRDRDTHTLRCDWFVTAAGTECEVHELFPDEQGLIEHKMNTMGPTEVLFRDYAHDHQAVIFGEVSARFVELVTQRMGPPTVFSFLQGLDGPGGFGHLGVTAHMKIRPGQRDGFTAQVAEILRLTRDNDTQTLRYDWFIDGDGTECEVHEAYRSERGLIEHNAHVMAARELLFEEYASDHHMSVYGAISPQLRDLFTKHAGGVREFVFLEGLEQPAHAVT